LSDSFLRSSEHTLDNLQLHCSSDVPDRPGSSVYECWTSPTTQVSTLMQEWTLMKECTLRSKVIARLARCPIRGTFGRNGKKEKLMIVQGGKWLQEKFAG
jgi:hypothetical protein